QTCALPIYRDPLTREHVAPHGGGVGPRVELALVDTALRWETGLGVVEVDQLAAVGEARASLDDTARQFGHSVDGVRSHYSRIPRSQRSWCLDTDLIGLEARPDSTPRGGSQR